MKRMRAIFPVLLLLTAVAFGCGNKSIRNEDMLINQYHPSGKDAIRDMVDKISAVNKKSPGSYAADFNVDGTIGEKTYKLLGNAQFSRKRRLMYVAFLDFIFRSSITTLFQEGDAIRIYYPVEKKLYVDNVKTIDLANYGGVSVNFDLLYSLVTGTIPLIPNYAVKQGLTGNDGKESMLIVENSHFYETISFNGNDPNKIKLINKNTREKFEIYIKKTITQGDSIFFSSIMIIAQSARIRLDIHFSRIRLNVPVKVRTIQDAMPPGKLKIIQM